MDITHAFLYIFDDPDWMVKSLITAVTAIVATLLLPMLIGFVAWAALLGYGVDIIRNVRDGKARPLPEWENYGDKIAKGGNVLVAIIVYNLPNLLLSFCLLTAQGVLGDTLGLLVTLFCLLPFLLVYNLMTWPMLVVGVIRFSDTYRTGEFFRFGDLFNTARHNGSLTIQWMIFAWLANLGLLFVNVFPVVGWLLSAALTIPVQAHLIGQYALAFHDDKAKPKRRS
ncbi:MAG: DUF4013 domain-containing protein [Chloroflexi bacterium]|nr:MAG: DUF4013 domain-containing protein [Chloroflexota bacterium]